MPTTLAQTARDETMATRFLLIGGPRDVQGLACRRTQEFRGSARCAAWTPGPPDARRVPCNGSLGLAGRVLNPYVPSGEPVALGGERAGGGATVGSPRAATAGPR